MAAQIKKYWETTPDVQLDTGRNVLRWFAQAGKLQISMPYWTDSTGEQKPGKTVTIDIDALRETEGAAELFKAVLE